MAYVSVGKYQAHSPYPRLDYGYGMLGDASYDAAIARYQADRSEWLKEKAAYDLAVHVWEAQSAGAGSAYASQLASYGRDLAAWNAESAAHTQAVLALNQQQLAIARAKAKANAAAVAAGVVLPAGYPGCVSQSDHDSWKYQCDFLSVTVKGLGASPTGSLCALSLLPVCVPAPALPPLLRPKPPPPPAPAALPAPAPLRPEPTAPAPPAVRAPTPVSTPPVVSQPPITITAAAVPSPASAPATAAPLPGKKSAGLLSNGLLLVVLAGGGYALYRTFRKPKPKAS